MSFKAYKCDDLKVVYSLKLDGDSKPEMRWVISNVLLETVSLDDPTGHLFIVDIEFDEKNEMERELL